MANTPHRFAGPALVSGAATTVYTVPSSTAALLRHIHVHNPSASPIDLTISIGTDSAATRIMDGMQIKPYSSYEMPCYEVLSAATVIQAFASSSNILTLTQSLWAESSHWLAWIMAAPAYNNVGSVGC